MVSRGASAAWVAVTVLAAAPLLHAQAREGSRIANAVVNKINARIQGALAVRDMDFQAPNGLVLRGVSLTDPDGQTVAVLATVRAKVDLGALALGELSFEDLEILDPVVHLRPRGDRLNLAAALAPRAVKGTGGGSATGLELEIRGLRITGGTVDYAAESITAEVTGVATSGFLRVLGSTVAVQGAVSATTARFTAGDVRLELLGLEAPSARFAGRALTVDALEFRVPESRELSRISGRVVLTGQENLGLTGSVHLPAGYWPAGLGAAPAHAAAMAADVNITGSFADPRARVVVTTPQLDRDEWHLETVRVEGVATRRHLEVEALTARTLGGTVRLHGSYGLQDQAVDATVLVRGVDLARWLPDLGMEGEVSGDVRVSGHAERMRPRLVTSVEAVLDQARHPRVRLPDRLALSARASVDHRAVKVERAHLEGIGFRADAKGHVDTRRKALLFNVQARAEDLAPWIIGLPEDARIQDATVRAAITGTVREPVVEGAVHAAHAQVQGVPAEAFLARFRATRGRVELPALQARVAHGRVTGTATLELTGARRLDGRLLARGLHFPKDPTAALPGPGLDVRLNVGGTLEAPEARLTARGRGVRIRNEVVDDLDLGARLEHGRLDVERLALGYAGGRVDGKGHALLPDRSLDFTLDAKRVDIARVEALSGRQLTGWLEGRAVAAGTWDAPTVHGRLQVPELRRGTTVLGGVDVDADLVGNVLEAQVRAPRLGARAAGQYQLHTRALALDVQIPDGDLRVLAALVPQLPTLDGRVTITATAQGDLEDPRVDAHVRLRHALLPATETSEEILLGDGMAQVQHGQHQLLATAEFFGMADLRVGGGTAPGQWLRLDGSVHAEHLEHLMPEVRRRALVVAAQGTLAGDIPIDNPRAGMGELALERLQVTPGDQPPIHLARPARLRYAGGLLEIDDVELRSAKALLAVGGRVSARDVDVRLDGALDLAVLPALLEEVSEAQGVVDLRGRVTRRGAGPLDVVGDATPRPGARVLSRSLGTPVVFRQGRLVASQDAVTADNLVAQVGDGDVTLNGRVDLQDSKPARYDVVARGLGLQVKTSRGPLEGGFNVALTGSAAVPRLAGTVEITDGQLRESYQVQNFIVVRPSAPPSEPLWKRVPQLATLVLDVRVLADGVRARGDLGPYQLDTTLRSDVTLAGTLREPSVTGAVEVTEGEVRVAQSRFSVESAALEFPLRADNRIQPEVHVTARTVLTAERSPTQTELPVILTLDGPLDRMVMDLKAEGEGAGASRMELLSLIVTGRPAGELLGGAAGQAGGDAAMRLASSQAMAFFERRLEEQARQVVNSPVEFRLETGTTSGRATARWEANTRLQLEGSTDLDYGAGSAAAGMRGAARARLLLLDHTNVPLLQTVAFEGSLSDVGVRTLDAQTVDLKLRCRFLEF